MKTAINNVLTFLNRKLCSHPTSAMIRKFTTDRIYGECTLCGFTTPGFYLGKDKVA